MEGWNAFSRRNRVFVPNPPNPAGAAGGAAFSSGSYRGAAWAWGAAGFVNPAGSAGGVAAEASRRSLFKM